MIENGFILFLREEGSGFEVWLEKYIDKAFAGGLRLKEFPLENYEHLRWADKNIAFINALDWTQDVSKVLDLPYEVKREK